MGTWATGKYALMISDRSGMAFPYREMMQEWTGSWVHSSEYESKQPQLTPPYHSADAVALQHPRPQHKSGIVATLEPALWFVPGTAGTDITATPNTLPPQTANEANKKRQVTLRLGTVTVST